jgi:hypothetical protein
MSQTPDPKPLTTFVFDEVTVFTLKAESNPKAVVNAPASEHLPLLTVEADEMAEFVVKAIPAADLAAPSETTEP